MIDNKNDHHSSPIYKLIEKIKSSSIIERILFWKRVTNATIEANGEYIAILERIRLLKTSNEEILKRQEEKWGLEKTELTKGLNDRDRKYDLLQVVFKNYFAMPLL